MKSKKTSLLATVLLALFLISNVAVIAQDSGIHFEHGLSWAAVKEKAKRENKFIFMDCYTTWCGPCKVMSKNIFPQKIAGDFFNDKFINVKVQFDQTDSDKVEIKNWYADAAQIGKDYNVLAYPTFLYFTPEGELVHLYVGSTNTAEEFIEHSSKALNPSTQYYSQLKKMVAEAKGDPEVLRKLVMDAKNQYDGLNSAKLADMYLRTQKDLVTKENLTLLDEFTKSSSDYGFDVFVDQTEKVNAIMGKGFAQKKIASIAFKEEGAMEWLSKKTDSGYADVEKRIRDKYPAQADGLMARLKLYSLQARRDNEGFMKQVVPFVAKFNKEIYPAELSGLARYVSIFSTDPAMLKRALNWSNQAVKEEPVAEHKAATALILYKLGKKAQAIAVQKEVIVLAEKQGNKYVVQGHQDMLAKMEKGEKI